MSDERLDRLVEAIRAHSSLTLRDIEQAGEHGADAGWGGFTYTTDGADFTSANRGLLWEMLAEEAEDMGSPNVAAYVGTFVRADMAETPEGFDCLVSWWALETAGRYLADTAEERRDDETERMRELGEEYGKRAASWLLDGNSTPEAAERLLRGILEGDPEIMDQLPSDPLSGEWADGLTLPAMLAEADIPDHDELEPEAEAELADAFCDGYDTGVHDGAESLARTFLGLDGVDLGDCGSKLAEALAEVRSAETV